MQIILVTGATGYIGSRLIPRLLDAGYHVRCLARHPERLRHRPWYPRIEVVPGDVTRPETLPAAMQDVSAAYYLIHSMAAGHGYARLDLESARNFAHAAKNAGVEHIIYLGGLADERDQLAMHLRSRIESGAALREAGVPVTEFRAGVISGPGSVSFEMIRFIAEQFPLMVGPAWLRHKSQPIATENVLDYLLAALTTPACRGQIIGLGCAETFTYIEIMHIYARMRGLQRASLLLPFVPVWLMAFLISILTPVQLSYALPLVEGLQNDSLVLDRKPLGLFPDIQLIDYVQSIHRSLADLQPDAVERTWLDLERDAVQTMHEGFLVDYRRAVLPVSAAEALQNAEKAPGAARWPVTYRLETAGDGLLRFKADSHLPGDCWLELQTTPQPDGCLLEQTAFFAPKGLPGFLYWHLLKPFHHSLFKKLIPSSIPSQNMKRFLLIFSGILIIIGLAVVLSLVLPPRKDTYDFVMLYTANLGILNRVPIYDTPALEALTIAKTAAEPGKFSLYPYPYPPWYALSTFYLGWLPPKVAANAWLLLNIAMLVVAIFLLTDGWRPSQRILALLAGLLFIPSLGLIIVGQYSMPVLLGAALFYHSTRRSDAPLAALGLLLMTFKPHIGVILFAAGFFWLLFQKTPFARRALWLTIGGGLALAALGFLADPAWPLAYIKSLLSYSTIPGVANRDLSASFSVAIIKILLGLPSAFWSYWLSLALIIFMLILFLCRRIFSNPAALVAGAAVMTLLGDPYMFNYDYVLLLLPLFILIARSKARLELAILAAVYLVPWLTLMVGVGGNILLNLAGVVTLGLLVFGKALEKSPVAST